DEAATRRLFTRFGHHGDVAGILRLADARFNNLGTDLVGLLAHRDDFEELILLAFRGGELLLDHLARVLLHRGALDELQAISTCNRDLKISFDDLANAFADRGDIARLRELAVTDNGWGGYVLTTVLACRGDLPALRAFVPVDRDGVAKQQLNKILVNRGIL